MGVIANQGILEVALRELHVFVVFHCRDVLVGTLVRWVGSGAILGVLIADTLTKELDTNELLSEVF